ncbi:MAG: peptidoglycan-binding protein [Parvibaculum sp.]|nr:peptidoglycan-binding protein [Parvibaculum sp.]
MRPGVPWSVKGIEPEAREAAKQAARRAGVTLGAWLNQVIMDGGTDEVGMPDADVTYTGRDTMNLSQNAAPQAQPQMNTQAPQTERVAVDLAPVAEAVRDIVSRVEQSERRTLDLARRMEQSVGLLAERLDSSERHTDDAMPDPHIYDPLERKIQQLSERLEQAERGRGGLGRKGADENKTQLQALEKAVNAVVDHLETAERRTDESLADIRRTLGEIAGRVDEHEEEEAREEAEARARAAEDHMQTLAQRLEKMEQSVSNVGGQAVDAALRAIAEKDDEERHKATIDNLQNHLHEITQRLERAEKRTDETLKTFELTVTGIARRLEDIDQSRDEQLTQDVDNRLEEMAQRLHQSEEMSLQAAHTIERAIAGMSDSLSLTENRSRDTIDNLNVMLERMTDRLGRIERETKATRSSITQTVASAGLSPQIPVGGLQSGMMGGAGFVPGGQAFPIPNFDAPSLGGYEPVSEFRSPEPRNARDHQVREPQTDMPHDMSGNDDDLPPPPPFAPGAGDGRVEPRLDARHAHDDDALELDEPIEAPVDEPARVANDFMAAARRAAQAAAINGRNGPQPLTGPNGYSDPTARYSALSQNDSPTKKILYGALAALVVAAIAIGAFRMLGEEPVIVATTAPTQTSEEQKAAALAPADMGANTETTVPATVPAVPSQSDATAEPETALSHPEATPEDAGAQTSAAPASATLPAIVPVAKPKPAKQANAVTDGPPVKAGPTVTPAPAKPVDTAPLDSDVPAGERALRSAAVAGNPAAQYEVGQRYANGENVPQDLAQAAYWYGQASDQGLAIAQYRLAALYEKGRGVAQDNAKARSLYEKAATQGNVKAMHNLAVIYAEGRGTRQDFTSAARWFNAAADYGLGDSQYNLAILQERGLGVTQDLELAYKWLSIAARGGDKGAAQKREEVGGKLDPAKLARAKVAIETWSPKRPDPAANGDLSGMGSWASAMNGDMTASITPAAASNEVSKAQAMLMKLGYEPGSSDGLMGPRTRDAIAAYQRSAGLEPTGSVNAALLMSLEIATR